MLQGIRIVISTLVNLCIVYLRRMAFGYLNIGYEVYGPYLLWLSSLTIFWALLPQEVGEVFNSLLDDEAAGLGAQRKQL